MKNIDTILEEFRMRFSTGETDMEGIFHPNNESEDREVFLRTAFAEYKKGLREAVEGMKQLDYPEYDGENRALDSVLELLK